MVFEDTDSNNKGLQISLLGQLIILYIVDISTVNECQFDEAGTLLIPG